jgi:hypothetical protein
MEELYDKSSSIKPELEKEKHKVQDAVTVDKRDNNNSFGDERMKDKFLWHGDIGIPNSHRNFHVRAPFGIVRFRPFRLAFCLELINDLLYLIRTSH